MIPYRNVKFTPDGMVEGEQTAAVARGGRPTEDDWTPFVAGVDLLWINEATSNPVTLRLIWEAQDGMPGLPLGEYDWSAIRDSSPAAVKEMLAIAARVVSWQELLTRLGVKQPTLEERLAKVQGEGEPADQTAPTTGAELIRRAVKLYQHAAQYRDQPTSHEFTVRRGQLEGFVEAIAVMLGWARDRVMAVVEARAEAKQG